VAKDGGSVNGTTGLKDPGRRPCLADLTPRVPGCEQQGGNKKGGESWGACKPKLGSGDLKKLSPHLAKKPEKKRRRFAPRQNAFKRLLGAPGKNTETGNAAFNMPFLIPRHLVGKNPRPPLGKDLVPKTRKKNNKKPKKEKKKKEQKGTKKKRRQVGPVRKLAPEGRPPEPPVKNGFGCVGLKKTKAVGGGVDRGKKVGPDTLQ